jgi:hypothetical protein
MEALKLVTNDTATSTCSTCGVVKPVASFTHRGGKLRGTCKDCQAARRAHRAAELAKAGSLSCSACRVEKSAEQFSLKARGSRLCRECQNGRAREWYANNIDHARDYHRLKARGYYSFSREFDPIRWMLNLCRNRAHSSGIPFDLTREDIFLPEFCPVLGIRLRRPGEGQANDSPSLDRIDATRGYVRGGYVRGNVAIISMLANRLKNNGTAEQHERIAAWMRAQGAR